VIGWAGHPDLASERLKEADVTGDVIWSIGDAAQEIVDEAQANHASKLVIGAHHHHRFEHLLGTNVTENIERDERKRRHIPVGSPTSPECLSLRSVKRCSGRYTR
jgi:K+-sensing histidine kinase KdpD